MLRITIEEVPEATCVPRGPARREGDMLWPEAALKPKVKYQQSWLEDETHPNVTMLIGLLNGLDVPEVCSRCGHDKEQHHQGQGKCYGSHRVDSIQYGHQGKCDCPSYKTAQQEWNATTLHVNNRLVKEAEELKLKIRDVQSGEIERSVALALTEAVPILMERLKPKRRTRRKT